MMEYPRGRIYMLRKEVELLKQRLADNNNHTLRLVKFVSKLQNKNTQLHHMLSKVEELRRLVYTKMAPFKGTLVRQQELIFNLYKELGHTDYSAWFAGFKNV